MYSITIFERRFDNTTNKRIDFDSWDKFEKFLYKLSERPLKGKDNAELISPAIYVDNTTRSNKNVTAWAGWAAVDVDDHVFKGNLEDELRSRYGDWSYVCYSTASSVESHPKFRLVFPLARHVQQEQIKHFWFALNSELDFIGDRQTKDLSRMYYIPATYAGAYNFIFNNNGDTIDPDYLCAKWKYDERKDAGSFLDRLPPAWREQVIEHRKSQLNNTNIVWSGYQDCPFWPKRLASEYQTISSTGWYRKMYQIMIATAGSAIKQGYPITAKQIAELCRQFDTDTGKWYENRPLEKEADHALEYVYKHG